MTIDISLHKQHRGHFTRGSGSPLVCAMRPHAFQRFINFLLGNMKGCICDPYLDDVLCYSESFDDSVKGLRKILHRLKTKGVKLRAEKCVFIKSEGRYLCWLISGEDYCMGPKDAEALDKFREPPSTVGD